MNELEIIQQQLDTERSHFVAVASACAQAVREAGERHGEFKRACADYFAFAVTRLECDADVLQQLQKARSSGGVAPAEWLHFTNSFEAQVRARVTTLEALKGRNRPITEWRAAAGIDADSIMAERALYRRIVEALPAGISLEAPRS